MKKANFYANECLINVNYKHEIFETHGPILKGQESAVIKIFYVSSLTFSWDKIKLIDIAEK